MDTRIPSNVVESWDCYLSDNSMTQTAGLKELSDASGMSIKHNRISEWRSGSRPMPSKIVALMASLSAPCVALRMRKGGAKLRRKDVIALTRALSPPQPGKK